MLKKILIPVSAVVVVVILGFAAVYFYQLFGALTKMM